MAATLNSRLCRLKYVFYFCSFIVFALWTAYQVHAYYIFKRYGFQWFEEALPRASEVSGKPLHVAYMCIGQSLGVPKWFFFAILHEYSAK